MLYVTTRNDQEVFTAQWVLMKDRGEDGGFFVPFHDPCFSEEDMTKLMQMPFNQCIAEVLNVLFQTRLTGWDVDFCVGRCPVRMVSLRQRILIGELWHNPEWDYRCMEANLAKLVKKDTALPGSWTRIAIRSAVLFAVCGELNRSGVEKCDIAVLSSDFLWPISVWYARKWGLPVENIVICCNENQNVWELVCHGEMRTDSLSISTNIPEADIPVPVELERLIYGCCGQKEVERYQDCCRRGAVYTVNGPELYALRNGQFVSVISSSRIRDTIPGVLHTHNYLLSPGTAIAYAGMLDYRAKKGEFRPVVVLSEKAPSCDAQTVAMALGMTVRELEEIL